MRAESPPVPAGQEIEMDFIERIFGWSPDGGDGSFEFLLFALPIAGLCYLAWRRRQRRSLPHRDGG